MLRCSQHQNHLVAIAEETKITIKNVVKLTARSKTSIKV